MKRELALRKLHMGCGECLIGRVWSTHLQGSRVPVARQTRTAQRQAGKDRR